jgi:Ribonuclease G/E
VPPASTTSDTALKTNIEAAEEIARRSAARLPA